MHQVYIGRGTGGSGTSGRSIKTEQPSVSKSKPGYKWNEAGAGERE